MPMGCMVTTAVGGEVSEVTKYLGRYMEYFV